MVGKIEENWIRDIVNRVFKVDIIEAVVIVYYNLMMDLVDINERTQFLDI